MKNLSEKIYIQPNAHDRWFEGNKPNDNFVEYIQKDAFIEKVTAYLNEKFYFNNLHCAVENNTFNCMEEMFEDFKKYIE